MARYGLETNLEPDQVIEKAASFFGEEGMNMELVDQRSCCVRFGGTTGYVEITATREQDTTAIELLTDEWDYDVRQFMEQVGG